MTALRIGYFEGFKSSNTLLLEADTDGLRALAQLFRSLAAGTLDDLDLHDLPFAEARHGVLVTATRGARDRSAQRGDAGPAFLWERTQDGWRDAADRLDLLSQHQEGHHHLDGDGDEVVIQVSKGEYGDDWWQRHG